MCNQTEQVLQVTFKAPQEMSLPQYQPSKRELPLVSRTFLDVELCKNVFQQV